MDFDELRQYVRGELQGLPREAAIAFAARAAMRALPLLVANTRFGGETFSFWKKEARAQNLLAIFGAYNAVLGIAVDEKGLDKAVAVWRRRARAAADAAYADAAYAAAYAADAAHAAYAAYAADATDAAADAADAAYAAADAAYAAYAAAAKHYIVAQYKNDLKILSRKNCTIKEFLNLPLWNTAAPPLLNELFEVIKKEAIALDPGFSYWFDFYKARLDGKPLDIAQLRRAVLIQDSLFESGAAQVNAYLLNREKEEASAPLNRVRAIFIGYGEAGKTSLINVLHGKPVQPQEPQTPGVDIHEWPVPNTDIIAHLWDFGGQVMVHATHQLFLRESCLYVLVISARSEINATEQAEYWLEHVKSYGGNAPVLIVGNRVEQTDLNIDMGVLKQKYPNIVRYFPLSCERARTTHESHFNAFQTVFCEQLKTLETHQMRFTPEQFAVLQALRERTPKTSFLSKAAFDELCDTHKISTDEVQNRDWLIKILDKLGVIIHFENLPFADGYVLNPRWLTYGVYTLMYAKKDHLPITDIITILGKEKISDGKNILSYSRDNCRLIMDAMREFKLCYSLADQPNTLIIPALLSSHQPDIEAYKTSGLAFELAFKTFLPRHIMPELIVTRHAEILSKDGQQLVWQNGVILQKADAQALLRVDYQARKLQIWVSGSGAREYLAVLRDALQVILDRMIIEYKAWIILPESARLRTPATLRSLAIDSPEEESAPYAQVLAHANAGNPEFITESGAVYDVLKVLQLFISDERRSAELRQPYGTARHPLADPTFTPATTQPNPEPAMTRPAQPTQSARQTVKIFLASSAELREERDALELHLRQLNDELQEENRYLKVVRWENFLDAVSATSKQDDYNRAIQDCDIFLSLFATKTGKYTQEEFNVAHQQFKATGRPWIFTFFRETDLNTASLNRADLQSLWAFQDQLKQIGHFWTNYKNTADLQLRVLQQLKHYFAQAGQPAAAIAPATPAVTGGNQTVNIIGGTIHGNIVNASNISNSFNKT